MGDCCSLGELEAHAVEECGQMAYLVNNDREGSGGGSLSRLLFTNACTGDRQEGLR